MQCNNYNRFGYTTNGAKIQVKNKKKCNLALFRINCSTKAHLATNYNFHKETCPVFMREKELQAIMAKNKVHRRFSI